MNLLLLATSAHQRHSLILSLVENMKQKLRPSFSVVALLLAIMKNLELISIFYHICKYGQPLYKDLLEE